MNKTMAINMELSRKAMAVLHRSHFLFSNVWSSLTRASVSHDCTAMASREGAYVLLDVIPDRTSSGRQLSTYPFGGEE